MGHNRLRLQVPREKKYRINELELLEVVWALEHFKHYLLGHKFTVQTEHRVLLSILKDRSSKIHQTCLTRWYERLIPFTFTIEDIPGSKIGMADYMPRNPDKVATPPSTYDADFIIAQINVIKDTLNRIRKRGRPKKENTEKDEHTIKIVRRRGRPRKHAINTQYAKRAAQQSTTTAPHDSDTQTTTGMESPHEYNNLKKPMEPFYDSKLLNFGGEIAARFHHN